MEHCYNGITAFHGKYIYVHNTYLCIVFFFLILLLSFNSKIFTVTSIRGENERIMFMNNVKLTRTKKKKKRTQKRESVQNLI